VKPEMTISTKLLLSFCAMLAATLVLAYASLSSAGKVGDEVETSVAATTYKVELINQAATALTEMQAGQRGIVLYSLLQDPAAVEASDQAFRKAAAEAASSVGALRPMLLTPKGRQCAETLTNGLSAWNPIYEQIATLCRRPGFSQESAGEVKTLASQTSEIQAGMKRATGDLTQFGRVFMKNSRAAVATGVSSSRWYTWSCTGLCLLAGGIVVWVIRRIGGRLRRLAGDIGDGAEQVAAAAAQVSTGSQSLAQGAAEQAAALEETSASSEEINSMTQKNAANAQVAAQSVAEATQHIERADRNLDQMLQSMNEINASSDKISKIIKVIDEIAFQTNILALNAAVEAARAGEAGMGFAVVADEVRNLAQRSAQAARDTAGLIEESIAKSHDGSNKLEQVAAAIRAMTGSTEKVKTVVEEVNAGAGEQARGIAQVSRAIAQMEGVTQQAAAHAGESAAAGEELSAQAERLQVAVGRLRGMAGGNSDHTEPPTPARAATSQVRSVARPAAEVHKPDVERASPHVEVVRNAERDFPLDG